MPQKPGPNLKLVGFRNGDAVQRWQARRDAHEAVASENRRAAVAASTELDPADPRWVLAARTRARLQGPILTPERRDRLQRLGHQLGLSPFDTSVVIATVQDQARQGRSATQLASTIVATTQPGERPHPNWLWRWGSAIVCAVTATWLLVWWLLNATTGLL